MRRAASAPASGPESAVIGHTGRGNYGHGLDVVFVGLPGVDNAFTALGDPEVHAKILVDPQSDAAEPVAVAI